MLVPIHVSEVMVSPVETVPPETAIREVATRLRTADVGSLVVVEAGDPVAIVTESDLVAAVADGRNPEDPVRAVASEPLVTVEPSVRLPAVADRLQAHEIKRLPVVDDGELVGIVTTTDLAHYLPRYALRVRPHEPDRSDWRFEFEDRAAAGVTVGDVVRFSKVISADDVRAFADASGDENPIHLDPEYAEHTRFGHPIVQGILTVGVVSAALARLPGLTIYLSQDVSFLNPVDVGATVEAVCEVVDDLGGGRFRLTTRVFDDDGELVVDGNATVLIDDAPEVATESRGAQAVTS